MRHQDEHPIFDHWAVKLASLVIMVGMIWVTVGAFIAAIAA